MITRIRDIFSFNIGPIVPLSSRSSAFRRFPGHPVAPTKALWRDGFARMGTPEMLCHPHGRPLYPLNPQEVGHRGPLLSSTLASALAQASPRRNPISLISGSDNGTSSIPRASRAGRSRIESIGEGAGILENWTDSSGTTGKSLNVYNAQKKCWQQFWVGSGPCPRVVRRPWWVPAWCSAGRGSGQKGRRSRIASRTPNADGTVGQHWESLTRRCGHDVA